MTVEERTNPLDLITLRKVGEDVGVYAPACNGNWDHDYEALFAFLSEGTVRALLAVARAGGDDLHIRSIGRITKKHKGNVAAVLAYYGFIRDRRGVFVGFDEPLVVPVDPNDSEYVATLLFMARHFPGVRVQFNVWTAEVSA